MESPSGLRRKVETRELPFADSTFHVVLAIAALSHRISVAASMDRDRRVAEA